ncbi:MAG: PhnD/SsuA/transferrin family substrate-binding protein [Nostocaceae cyanobacterium]|nr:PhnD/SsuA/transferrin family substrate-binding protein [Nostocaceae cyanobacterium]
MIIRRFLLLPILVLIGLLGVGCSGNNNTEPPAKLTIGLVSYGEGKVSLNKYERFKEYIAARTKSMVELEPAYNELRAITQINRKRWDIVFAPPGLAAIAIAKQQYNPLFSMEGVSSRQRSLIVVRDDSQIRNLTNLARKNLALGETGSAAGYYLPLYDLYGLTLNQIFSAPTPKQLLAWVNEGKVDAGALSEKNFEIYKRQFSETKFRIIHTSRWIPPSVVVIAPTVDRNRQEQIKKAMSEAPADITADAGYIPTAKIPNYEQFIKLVTKVRPLESRVKQVPAVLLKEESAENAEGVNSQVVN